MSSMRQLLESLQRIDEADPAPAAPAPAAPAPAAAAPGGDEEARFAAYTKKQEDLKAQTALVEKIKAMIRPQDDSNAVGKGYTIDPTNGMIFWSTPYGGKAERPEPVRMDQLTNLHKDIKQLLDSAGVSIVPSAAATGSAWNRFVSYGAGYPSVPQDQIKLIQSGKLPQKAQPAVAAPVVAAPVVAAPVVAAPAAVKGSAALDGTKPGADTATTIAGGPETTAGGLTADQVKTMLTTVRKLLGIPDIVAKENTVFKSLIGRTLLESFDLNLFEDADLDTMNKMWPQLVKWAETNKTAPEAQAIEGLRDQVTKWTSGKQQSTVSGGQGQNAAVTGSAALDGTKPGADKATTIAGGPETTAGGAGIVPSPEKKTTPDAAAVVAAGNHPPTGVDPRSYAAYNSKTGAMYDNDTIGPGSKDSGTDHRVADLQKKLGITPATGVYGDAEKKAISDFQTKVGITVDGKYGPKTKEAFEKDNNLVKHDYPAERLKSDTANKETDNSRPGLAKNGDPAVYDRQKALRDAGALNTKGKNKGKPLDLDGVDGDNTKAAETEVGSKVAPPDTAKKSGFDPAKRLTVKPVANPKAGVGPAGERIFTLGDGKNAYWDEKAKSYVPWDVNTKKVNGKPIPVKDFKLAASSTGTMTQTIGTDTMGNTYGAGSLGESRYSEDQSLARIVQLARG